MDWNRKLCRPPESDHDLKKIAKKAIRGAKVGDKPVIPPVEAIARYAEVKEEPEGLTSERLKDLARKFFDALPKCFGKVRGVLDRRGKTYYVDREIHEKRQVFTAYHEIAHDLIPWQKDAAYFDDDHTLCLSVVRRFEKEANTLAGHLMFQGDRFNQMAEEFELSLKTAKYLADQWGASFHAAFRQYVERNRRPCAMFIFKLTALKEFNKNPVANLPPEQIYYIAASEIFLEEYGCPKPEETLYPVIARPELLGQLLIKGDCEGDGLILSNGRNKKKYKYQAFTNQYDVFLMILPEKRSHLKKKVEFNQV